MRGSFLRWLSLILFLVLLDVVVLLPLLTPATHPQHKSFGTRHVEGATVVALHQGPLPVLTIRSSNGRLVR